MKRVLAAALISAAAASGATWLLADSLRTVPAPPAPDESLRAALEETRRELADLRARVAAGAAAPAAGTLPPAWTGADGSAVPAGGDPAPVPAPAAVRAVPAPEDVEAEEGPSPRADRERRDREAAARRPAEAVERLRGVAKWDEDPEVRRVWILSEEQAVVSLFGKPDEIWLQDGGSEYWTYRVPGTGVDEDGNRELEEILLVMSRGRLIRVDR